MVSLIVQRPPCLCSEIEIHFLEWCVVSISSVYLKVIKTKTATLGMRLLRPCPICTQKL